MVSADAGGRAEPASTSSRRSWRPQQEPAAQLCSAGSAQGRVDHRVQTPAVASAPQPADNDGQPCRPPRLRACQRTGRLTGGQRLA